MKMHVRRRRITVRVA